MEEGSKSKQVIITNSEARQTKKSPQTNHRGFLKEKKQSILSSKSKNSQNK